MSTTTPRRIRVFRISRSVVLMATGLATLVWGNVAPQQNQDIPEEFLSGTSHDEVASLVQKIKSGSLKLNYEPEFGYLKSLLQELRIPLSSQVLVFSKTSLQSAFISPNTPRAIYFNDHAYVGWIPGAPFLEIVSIDPEVGPIFYTLENHKTSSLSMKRQTMECFQCHYSGMTSNVPGLMARSVYAAPDGQPRFANGSYRTTASSPMKERWGGWYVTGQHGSERHMGNEPSKGPDDQSATINMERGANVSDLGRYFSVGSYLTPHSDIVALMVFEKQMAIQNLITKAGMLTRRAEKDIQELLKIGFSKEHADESLQSRVTSATEPLVKALLGVDEITFSSPIKGSSTFAAEYSASSPADSNGRRLSELDLASGLQKYSCSPLIYSKSFDGLPKPAKDYVYRRFKEILSGTDKSKTYAFLNTSQRETIRDILMQTKPDLASAW